MDYALIPGFPAYRVYRDGQVFTRWRTGAFYNGFEVEDRWREMHLNERPDGYRHVDLRDGYGGNRKVLLHILICGLFNGDKPFPRAVVRHMDGNPANNAASNLAWGTYFENEADKKVHGTWESRTTGKLTSDQRNEIITRAGIGASQRQLAIEFNVSRPTITRLLNGSTWKQGGLDARPSRL